MNSPQIQHLNNLSCKILFSTGYHCQFLDVCQGMKQISTIYQEYVNYMFRLLKSNLVFSSLMTLHRILNIGNMTGMRSSSSFNMGHVAQYLVSVLQRSPLFFLDVGHFSKYNFDSCLIVPQFFRYFF
jgi:hypothetical protein